MAPKKTTSFQDDWLQEPTFKFIIPVKDRPHSAHCSLCLKTFDLSNMGKTAMKSHIVGKKHSAKMAALNSSYGIRMFGGLDSQKGEVSRSSESKNPGDQVETKKPEGALPSTSNDNELQRTDSQPPNTVASKFAGISQFILKEDRLRSEILWCLLTVMNHMSLSAASKCVEAFPAMFPDSQIASSMLLGRAKMSYVTVHGLAPYYHDIVLKEVRESDAFVAYFDESLNKTAQSTQMDLAIGYWDKKFNQVRVRYLSSAFLGHTKAVDLLEAFNEKLKPFSLTKLLNVSIDGPNVNLKFVKDLRNHLESQGDPNVAIFIFFGSCGLHTGNNSFKAGAKATGWKIEEFLRADTNLFKNVPSRRSDYIHYSGSDVFPLKFCAVRWLQNRKAADRAIAVLPNLQKYVTGVERDGKAKNITATSYQIVKNGLKDKLIAPKLAFFSYVAGALEPFLTEFQSTQPMAPFLYSTLEGVLADLMKIFVKAEVLDKAVNISKIDLKDDKTLQPASKLNLSFSVRAELKKVDASQIEILKFKNECRDFLKVCCLKLLEKSPLKYELCKGISCFDPSVIGSFPLSSQRVLSQRLLIALTKFQESNWLSPKQCDSIEKEYKAIIAKCDVHDLCRAYKREEVRLDDFWMTLLTNNRASEDFVYFIKLVLLLSHGNAFVERGFSINKEMVIENQKNISLVAQRQIYDGVLAAGGLQDVQITAEMLNKVKYARQTYMDVLEEAKKTKETSEKEAFNRKRTLDRLRELKEKRMRLSMEHQKETAEIDEEIANLGLEK